MIGTNAYPQEMSGQGSLRRTRRSATRTSRKDMTLEVHQPMNRSITVWVWAQCLASRRSRKPSEPRRWPCTQTKQLGGRSNLRAPLLKDPELLRLGRRPLTRRSNRGGHGDHPRWFLVYPQVLKGTGSEASHGASHHRAVSEVWRPAVRSLRIGRCLVVAGLMLETANVHPLEDSPMWLMSC